MKTHEKTGRIAAGLLALLLAGAGLSASAESWPEDTVQDAEGKTYKQVRTEDGGVQVWQFIGVFGSPEEALVSVGLSEKKDQGAGKVEIVSTPYKYKMKKSSEKTETGGATKQETKRKGLKAKKRARRLSKARNAPVTSIDDIWRGYNQIYIQDNRGSGR